MATVSPAGAVGVQALRARFVENGAGTYTATFNLPAGATLVDIIVEAEALWTAATSASLEVGDAGDPDGYLTAVDLKATDLLAGESVSLGGATVLGGVGGAYTTVGTSTHLDRNYSASASVITATVVSVGAGTAGRTRVTVLYVGDAFSTVTQ
jgi:hypothetical protein